MRVLVVGAGAVGGYFGGRLLEAGRDVTFLVRAPRAAALARTGLVLCSPAGDATLRDPPTVLADRIDRPYDLILLSCKAYDLDGAIAAFAPAVGADTAVLPLLNGMRHLAALDDRFGAARVLGGQCAIAATLDEQGAVLHLAPMQSLSFGERDGPVSDRIRAIAEVMADAKFESRASERILLEMWEKWVMLASMAASTCLMRAPVGDIVAAPGGTEFVLALVDECRAVAEAAGHPPRAAALDRVRGMLTTAGSLLTASMFRDIERSGPIEADHIIGDLIARATAPTPVLRLVYTHLKAYEARRARAA